MVTLWPALGRFAGAVKVAVAVCMGAPPDRSAAPNEPVVQVVEVASELPSAPTFLACRLSVVAVEPVAVTVALATVPELYVVPATCPPVVAALMAPAKL